MSETCPCIALLFLKMSSRSHLQEIVAIIYVLRKSLSEFPITGYRHSFWQQSLSVDIPEAGAARTPHSQLALAFTSAAN